MSNASTAIGTKICYHAEGGTVALLKCPCRLTLVLPRNRERKFILGNAKGEVAVYNFRNGAKMKDLDTQFGPIAGLVYCEQEKAVLVACQVRTGNRAVIRRRTTACSITPVEAANNSSDGCFLLFQRRKASRLSGGRIPTNKSR